MTVRERCMLSFVNNITDKPGWQRKVHDTTITTKWKQEVTAVSWSEAGLPDGDMSEAMFQHVTTAASKRLCRD
jgi:hypothetical protein